MAEKPVRPMTEKEKHRLQPGIPRREVVPVSPRTAVPDFSSPDPLSRRVGFDQMPFDQTVRRLRRED